MDFKKLFSMSREKNKEESHTVDETDPKKVTVPSDRLDDFRQINNDLTSAIYRLGTFVLEVYDRFDAIENSIDNIRERRQAMADEIEAEFISEDSESDYVLELKADGKDGKLIRSDIYNKETSDVPVNTEERDNVDPKKTDEKPERDILRS